MKFTEIWVVIGSYEYPVRRRVSRIRRLYNRLRGRKSAFPESHPRVRGYPTVKMFLEDIMCDARLYGDFWLTGNRTFYTTEAEAQADCNARMVEYERTRPRTEHEVKEAKQIIDALDARS